jgi:hypothetical protein
MRGASRPRVLVLAVAVALLTVTHARAGGPTCDESFSAAPALIREGHFLGARDALLRCSADDCPAAMRPLCVSDLHDIGPRLPSVVFSAKSAAGADLLDVRVVEHDVVVAARLDGRAVDVDPGPHTFRFEQPSAAPVVVDILAREGEKARPVAVEMAARISLEQPLPPRATPLPPSVATPPESHASHPWGTLGLVAAGAGVVSLGVGTYFGLDAISKDNTSNRTGCNGDVCAPPAFAVREDARTEATVSTVLFFAGGALVAGGATLWLFARRREAADATHAVQVAPVPLVGGGGLTVAGGWR